MFPHRVEGREEEDLLGDSRIVLGTSLFETSLAWSSSWLEQIESWKGLKTFTAAIRSTPNGTTKGTKSNMYCNL
jgi:hypothetical protein